MREGGEQIAAATILAVCIFVFGLLFYQILVAPLLGEWAYLSKLEARTDRVLAILSVRTGAATSPEPEEELLSGFISGDSENAAMSELQGRIQDTILRHGGGVNSLSDARIYMPDENLVQLQINISFEITHSGFVDVVAELEHGEPQFFISNLKVQSRNGQQDVSQSLSASLLVGAFYIPGEETLHES